MKGIDIDIMIFYIIYIILCVFILFILKFVNIKNTKQSWIVISVLIILNAILAGTRSFDMPDTKVYKYVFDNSINIIQSTTINSFSDFFFNRDNNSIEIGFIYMMYFVKKIGFSFRFFLTFVSILTSLLFVKGMELIIWSELYDDNEYAKWIPKSLVLCWIYFVMFAGILYTSVVLRSGLSMAAGLMFIGIMKKSNTNKIFAFCFLFIAIAVHSTGTTWILIYFLSSVIPRIINKGRFILVWGLLLLGYFMNVAQYTILGVLQCLKWIMDNFNINAFSSYFIGLEFVIQKREYFIIVVVGILCILAFEDIKIIRSMSLNVLVGVAIYTFAYPINAISREVDYFICFFIPLVSIGLFLKTKWKHFFVDLLMVCLAISQFFSIWSNM